MSTDAYIKFPSKTKILVITIGQSWWGNIFKLNNEAYFTYICLERSGAIAFIGGEIIAGTGQK